VNATGRCLCGQVRWAIHGPVHSMAHCHCSMCRKHHGALFSTWLAVAAADFEWLQGLDGIVAYRSSDQGLRPFCGTCGSSVPVVFEAEGLAASPAGSLEGEIEARPERHMFAASAPAWGAMADDLPRHDAFPPGIEGQPVERPTPDTEPGLILGGCLCGAVAFEADADQLVLGRNCHCSRCRALTGSAHASNLFLPLDALRFRQGEALVIIWKLPDAVRFASAFCSRCGSIMPRPLEALGRYLIPMGSLDTDPGMAPSCHIFVADKAAWFQIADRLPQYEGYAPS